MGRKTKKVPSCIYKYRLFAPQGETVERTEDAFRAARVHYNKLITIERRRRERYRAARSRLFPALAALEARPVEIGKQIEALRSNVQMDKVESRSRKVDPEKKAAIAALVAERKALLPALRAAREACAADPALKAAAAEIDREAGQAIKALRLELYWGTYLLVEAAAQAAKRAVKDPDYEETPPHRLQSRIGVHFCPGVAPAKVVGGKNTLMRIDPVRFRLDRHDNEIATGKAARTLLQLRIDSEGPGGRIPIWATLPMIMHRPLPADALIKDAYIVRCPYTVRIPWQYYLCVAIEAPSFQRTLPGVHKTPSQEL